MKNADYARLLSHTAALLQITGGNAFRVRAFENAARTVKRLPTSIEDEMDQGDVTKLSGIGRSIAVDLRNIREHGSFPLLDNLKEGLPDGILDLLQIQGLGPKKVKKLFDELQIGNIEDLEKAIQSGEVASLSGFGAKTQENLTREIARVRRNAGRRPLPMALRAAAPILEMLRAQPGVLKAELAGSARRGREMVKDLDFVVAIEDAAALMEAFSTAPFVREIVAKGPTKTSVVLSGDLQADLRAVKPAHFGSLLHHFTGSKEHHVGLRSRARAMGLTISEYGVYKIGAPEGEPPVASQNEEDIYRALGLDFIPPEMREDSGEIDAASKGNVPQLLRREDIQGDLHMHTRASDGLHSIREMAEAARAFGHKYIVITDHSKSSTIANGLDEARLRAHMQDIDAVNASIDGIEVLKGIEVDILKDGTLDLPHSLLQELDFVVGSVHASMKQDSITMTARLLKAISSGCIHCIGHPTGRLLGNRDPYSFDLRTIIDACLKHRVALEINASAGRLDLKDTHARLAAEAGVPIIISTDSHSTQGFEQLHFGVQVARRAWLTADQVLNTRPWTELKSWYQRPEAP